MYDKIYDPLNKGRWYRFFIESDGTNVTLTESDIEDATVTTTVLKIPADYKVKTFVYDVEITGGTATQLGLKTATIGWTLTLPDKAAYDAGYVYIFAEKIN